LIQTHKTETSVNMNTTCEESTEETQAPIAIRVAANPKYLLSSSYKIFDKEITVGFGVLDLETKVVILNEKRGFLELNKSQWNEVSLRCNEVWKSLASSPSKKTVINFTTNESLRFKISRKNGVTTITLENLNKDMKIKMDIYEFENLVKLRNLITWTIGRYTCFNDQVKGFYDRYVETCFSMNVENLSVMEFFIPIHDTSSIDFLRLFNEIPVLCENKIQKDLFFKRLVL
jgi:hypothetical protein